jgi:hypothetical protein
MPWDDSFSSSSLPCIKYPLAWPSGSRASLGVSTQWNGLFQTFFLTLDPDTLYWTTNDGQSGSSPGASTDIIGAFGNAFMGLYGLTANDLTCSIDPGTQVMQISGSHTFGVNWATSDFPWGWLGFPNANVTASNGGIITGTMPVAGTWLPTRRASGDTYDVQQPSVAHVRTVAGSQSSYRFDGGTMGRTVTFPLEPASNVLSQSCPTPSGSAETMFRDAISQGRELRVYRRRQHVSSSLGYTSYQPREPTLLPWKRSTLTGLFLFDVTLDLLRKL